MPDNRASNSSRILQRLRNINPYEFESFVAELWERDGWETTVSPGSDDMGVDVIATDTEGMIEQTLAIQVKRYGENNQVGRPKVQQYSALDRQSADVDAAAIVTTSSFSDKAEAWAADNGVKLIDGNDLLARIRELDAEDLVDEYAPIPTTVTPEESGVNDEIVVYIRAETLDPAARGDPVEAGIEVPEQLEDIRYVGAGAAAAALIAWAVIPGNGWIVAVVAIGVVTAGVISAPERMLEPVKPYRVVHESFNNGVRIVEYNPEKSDSQVVDSVVEERLDGSVGHRVQYENPARNEPVVFDIQPNATTARQRAFVYARLEQRADGHLPAQADGSIPTPVASAGQDAVVAYRFAVEREATPTIASDMSISQDEVMSSLVDAVADE